MNDLISREEALETIRPIVGMWYEKEFYVSYEAVMRILESLPSAEPEERTAKVVPMEKEILGGTETITITSCELCKRDVTMWDRFCPNCGAKLERGKV